MTSLDSVNSKRNVNGGTLMRSLCRFKKGCANKHQEQIKDREQAHMVEK